VTKLELLPLPLFLLAPSPRDIPKLIGEAPRLPIPIEDPPECEGKPSILL
jgi:hypothetical protein